MLRIINRIGGLICLAHLLRELIFLEESEQHPFSKQFKELISTIFDIRKTISVPYSTDSAEAIELEDLLNQLLLITIDKEKNLKTAIFQASIVKY